MPHFFYFQACWSSSSLVFTERKEGHRHVRPRQPQRETTIIALRPKAFLLRIAWVLREFFIQVALLLRNGIEHIVSLIMPIAHLDAHGVRVA